MTVEAKQCTIPSPPEIPLPPRENPPPFRPVVAVRPLRRDLAPAAVEAGARVGARAADRGVGGFGEGGSGDGEGVYGWAFGGECCCWMNVGFPRLGGWGIVFV